MTLVLLIAVPLLAAALLMLAGDRLGRGACAAIGTAALAFAFGIAVAVGQAFVTGKSSLVAEIGPWLPLRGAELALRLEPASIPLILTLTAVGALVGLYAAGELKGRGGQRRFFVALELLVGGALLVVTARDLVLVLGGWGTVGLSTSLLLAHDRERPEAAIAGARSFVFARAADALLLVGTLALIALFRTVDIAEISGRLATISPTVAADSALLAATGLIVVAILVRTAQVPFQGWLLGGTYAPAAASAAVQGLAMLSGVALLLRLADALHPTALAAAAVVGGLTAIVAGASGLASGPGARGQAWITIAQLGAVVAVGAGGPPFAAFLVTIATALTRVSAVLASGTDAPPARHPVLAAIAAAGSVAVFVSAALLVGAERVPLASVLLVAAGLAAAHTSRVAVSRRRDGDAPAAERSALSLLAVVILTAAGPVFIALCFAGVVSLGAPASPLAPWPFFALAAAAVALGLGLGARGPLRWARTGRWAGRDIGLDGLVDRGLAPAMRWTAATLDHGGEATVDRALDTLGATLVRASHGVRRIGAGPVWQHEATLLAAAAAIALYWVLR